jgi:phosphotriesterase-related protein
MKNRVIRTVNGDIKPEDLGYCQCHEHLFIKKGISGEKVPSLIMEDLSKTSQELKLYYGCGGRAVVDAQPVGCGRMAKELKAASEQSGVHIIASTGFHKLDFYRKEHFVYRMEEDLLVKLFCTELTEGMYTDHVNGEEVPSEKGPARAGIIKTASDGRDIRLLEDNLPVYKKLFAAAGKAAKNTGAPVMTHLEMGRGADSQLEVLTAQGITPDRIIMSHLDRVINEGLKDYQLEVAKSGVYLQFDTIGRFKYHDDASEAELISWLCEKGFDKKILIGLDTTNERLKSYGGSLGLDYILVNFKEQLKKYGIGDELFHQFTVLNPMQALCIES